MFVFKLLALDVEVENLFENSDCFDGLQNIPTIIGFNFWKKNVRKYIFIFIKLKLISDMM